MSNTIATLAGTTGSGLSSERHIIYAVNSQNWWAFGFTGTNVLSTWYSTDGVSWFAGATRTLGHNHSSEGRNLSVGYLNFNGLDIAHISYNWLLSSAVQPATFRATIVGSVISFHATDTAIAANASPDPGAQGWLGTSIDVDSNQVVYVGNSHVNATTPYNYNTSAVRSTADPGVAESATAVTWTHYDLDSSGAAQNRSSYIVELGGGLMGLLADDASAATTTTGISWYKWTGSAWSGTAGNLLATGSIAAIDKNDWGACKVSSTDIHVVYRLDANSYVHRRWDGTTWGAGQTIPDRTSVAGGGIALSSDGGNVWLFAIDSDPSNTVRSIQWDGTNWGTWNALEASSATRTFVGCTKDVAQNKVMVYWTEGSSLVSQVQATIGGDPPGVSVRHAISALGNGVSSATLAVAFTGAQPTPGDKVVVGFWGSGFAGTPTATAVDSATAPNSFVAVTNSITASTQGAWIMQLDLPSNATWAGNYTVTVTFSASLTESSGGAIAYGNVTVGTATAVGTNSGAATPATPGSVNSPTGNSTYFGVVTDSTAANPATFTWGSSYVKQISQTAGNTNQAGSIGDLINATAAQNPSITIDSTNWRACQAVWVNAPNPAMQAFANPGATWRRHFWLGQRHPVMFPIGTVSVQNLQQALSGGLSFTGSGPAKAATKGLAGAGLSFTGSQARSASIALVLATLSFTGSQARSLGKSVAATLNFTGSGPARQLTKSLAAATLNFTGSQARSLTRALAATLSFTGSTSRRLGRAVAGGLSFTGSLPRVAGKGVAGGLSFTGSQARSVGKGLSGGLSFTGSQARGLGRALSATLSFVGSGPARQFGRVLSGGLSFTGSTTRSVGKGVAGGLSFTGSQARAALKGLSAGLSFTGSTARSIGKGLAAQLSFTGSATKALAKGAFAATLSFTGSIAAGKLFLRALTAGLSFTGSRANAVGKSLAAGLSFVGTGPLRSLSKGVAAGLSFTGSLPRALAKSLAGQLSFIGAIVSGKQFLRSLAGGLSFTGSQARSVGKGVTGSLNFTGSQARSLGKGLAGGLSFTGSQVRRLGKGLAAGLSFTGSQTAGQLLLKALAAGLSFTGSLASSKLFLQALSGTVSFTASQARRTGKALSATLSPSSSQSLRVSKGLAAGLSFAGSTARALAKGLGASLTFVAGLVVLKGGMVVQLIALTVRTRSMALVARTRSMALTAGTRLSAVVVWTRDTAVRIITRFGASRS